MEFCGHILGGGYRRPVPGRLLAIQKWAKPKTVRELRSFRGVVNWYGIYVENLAYIAAPLFEMLKTKTGGVKQQNRLRKLVWTAEADASFASFASFAQRPPFWIE